VKSGSRPLDDTGEFRVIKALAESGEWFVSSHSGHLIDKSVEARAKYVSKVLSFVDLDAVRPLKVVVNSGNGAAGPTFDAIAKRLADLEVPIDFIRVHHDPDHTFPNGIPHPLLPKNHAATADVVRAHGADMGVAFDGDFDRCFFFDDAGKFLPGEYVVGLLASIFLDQEQGGQIVHDPRVIWNTQDIIAEKGGVAVQSKTGHSFIKKTMRAHKAVYGGEMSAHHYFRDFAYCDSGMIPWLLVAELVSKSGRSLRDWVRGRFEKFPSSGERNFTVTNPDIAIDAVLAEFRNGESVDDLDGVSVAFADWRFNLRKSNTEPLVRLNIETRGSANAIEARVAMICEKLLL
jgi:phosphomannomutase